MSKRFGRNQKRRMREKTSALEKSVDHYIDVVSSLYKDKKTAEEDFHNLLKELKRISPNSVLFDPQKEEWRGEFPEHFRMHEESIWSEPAKFFDPDTDPAINRSFKIVNLSRISVKVKKEELSSGLHIVLRTPEGRIAYYVKDSRDLQFLIPRAILEEMLNYELQKIGRS